MLQAILLGNAQDGGVPQAGCQCENCRAAWDDPAQRRLVTALGLLDSEAGEWFLVDATPDVREQIRHMQSAAPGARLAGVLITHAHMGHYTGLAHFGFEAMNVRGLLLYGTRRLLGFLAGNQPWRQLIDGGHLLPREMAPGEWQALTPRLAVQPLLVPHRDEFSDTVALVARGPQRRLLYLPDIDSWDAWAGPPYAAEVRDVVAGVDVAVLDGCFYSRGELPHRDQAAIGHPFITDTAARLAGAPAAVYFTHLNHTNPLWRPGPERQWLAAQGYRAAALGERWTL